MPRHPPIALKTLDRSHCQCPSKVKLQTASAQTDQLLEIGPGAAVRRAHHMPRIERPWRRTVSIIARPLTESYGLSRTRLRNTEPEQIFSLRCHAEQAEDFRLPQTFFLCE